MGSGGFGPRPDGLQGDTAATDEYVRSVRWENPKDDILMRPAWEFYTGLNTSGQLSWSRDDRKAEPVFRYPRMTGENHVNYNKALKRYFMGNYGFHWGTCGNYEPSFPAKWMSADGRAMWMVSAGTFDDYNFTLQMLTLIPTEQTSSGCNFYLDRGRLAVVLA